MKASGAKRLETVREKAEKALQERTAKVHTLPRRDVEYLVHELGVYQIELENQNEELRRAQEALEQSHRLYADLFEFAPAGYFTFDKYGVVVAANQTGADQLGVAKAAVVGKPFRRFMESLSDWELFLKHLREGAPGTGGVNAVFSLRRADDSVFPARLQFAADGRIAGEGGCCRALVIDLTEHQRMQQALRDTEERYKLLFSRSPLPKWVIDLETFRFLDVNDAAARHYGFSREEFLNLTLADIRTAEEFEKFAHWARTCCARGEKFEGQVRTRHRKRTGEILEAEVHYTEIMYHGQRAGLAVIIDITERKRAEEALRESQERLRLFIEYAPAALAMFDRNMRYVSVSRRWRADYGLGDRDLAGISYYEIFPEIPERWREIHRRGLAGEVVREENDRFVRADGSVQWLRWEVRPWRTGGGTVGGIVIFSEDITKRRQAEDALRMSEEKFRQMADAMPQLVWTARADGTVDYYNKRVSEFEGFRQDAGGTWHWTPVLHPDDIDYSMRVWRKALETGETYQIEHRVRRKDGSFRWYLSRGEAARDANGRIIKWYGTATDIEDLKQAQAELTRAVTELERSNRELQQFAYVASHDLQEPLRTVSSFVELLAEKYRGKLDSAAARYINFVVDGAHRMSMLINDLLAFSRVGTQEASFSAVDMNSVYLHARGSLRRAIRDNGAVLSAERLPVVRGDETQLRQLMQNLIANALKFRKRDVSPRITVSGEQKGAEYVFAVKDNGIGIEPRFFDRIFVIFQRLHTRDEYPGTGVGLAICKRIVERHGGRIWVESGRGEGSTFYFTLPAKPTRGNYNHHG